MNKPRTGTVIPFDTLLPALTDRAALVGQTGTGKTTLARFLCSQRPYVVVLDPKGLIHWPGYEVHTSLSQLVKSQAARLTYRPLYHELQSEETIDAFFEWVYRRQNTLLYIDEVYAIAKGDQYPWHYGACLTRGRELNIAVYTATQRPARVPQIVFSESEHVYCFKLKLPRDRERVEEMAAIEADAIAALPKHHFFYAPQDGPIVGPLKIRLASGAAPTPAVSAAVTG